MEKRDFADMIIYFCQKVSEMNISRKCKMELLGMITAIEMKHDELMPKWIPVTEALPKNAEFVLLTIRRLDKSYSQIPFISVGYVSWNQNAWWCAHDGDCDAHNVEVLAWMPLPEPWGGDR